MKVPAVAVLGFVAASGMSTVALAGVQSNTPRLNTPRLNTPRLNTPRLNGAQLDGAAIETAVVHGVSVDGAQIGSLELVESVLVGSLADAPDSTCWHSELQSAPFFPLAADCSTCAGMVQDAYPECLSNWSSLCVAAAETLCSFDSYDLIGAVLVARDETGDDVSFRINAIETAPDPTPDDSVNENADILHYQVEYREPICIEFYGFKYCLPPPYGTWYPLCDETDFDGLYNRSLAVADIWADCEGAGCGGRTGQDGFIFACRDRGAIAKCVERNGYKPWKPIVVCDNRYPFNCWDDTLAAHHEACVRMLRADYCGDGVAHTAPNTLIDVWDLNASDPAGAPFVQGSANMPTWGFEASWRPDGAECVSQERFLGLDPNGSGETIRHYIDRRCPLKMDQLEGTSQNCQSGHHWEVVGGERQAYMMNDSSALIEFAGGDLPEAPEDDPDLPGGFDLPEFPDGDLPQKTKL